MVMMMKMIARRMMMNDGDGSLFPVVLMMRLRFRWWTMVVIEVCFRWLDDDDDE